MKLIITAEMDSKQTKRRGIPVAIKHRGPPSNTEKRLRNAFGYTDKTINAVAPATTTTTDEPQPQPQVQAHCGTQHGSSCTSSKLKPHIEVKGPFNPDIIAKFNEHIDKPSHRRQRAR